MASFVNALRGPSVTNQPPSRNDIRRNDIAVIVWVVFILFLGIGIRNNAVSASKTFELGEGLPAISVPADWIRGQSEDLLLRARNPRSASIFDAELNIFVRDLRADETLALGRSGLAVRRSQGLDRYREFTAIPATVLGDQEAILVTYAYVADPTRASGAVAPPVVVRAQDLVFVLDGKLVVITVAADAAEWDETRDDFRVVFDSLRFAEADVDVAVEEGVQ